jgi:hypothetical protein
LYLKDKRRKAMDALKDWKTTIPGVLVLIIAGAAMLLGKAEFKDFVVFASGLLGGGLLAVNTK